MEPADDADTDKMPLALDDEVVQLDDADVQEIAKAEKTGAVRACGECGRSVFLMSLTPPPAIDELVTSDLYWLPKGEDRVSESCIFSGTHDGPAWWFCPFAGERPGTAGWFVVRGVFRARVERL